MWNNALRSEFDQAIRKRIGRDHAGRFHLLVNRVNLRGENEFALCVSKGTAPVSLLDFHAPVPLVVPRAKGSPREAAISAGFVIDRRDRLHLVENSVTGATRYAVADLGGSAGLFRWRNPVSGQPGALAIAPRDSRLGDITLAPDGTVWVTWVTRQTDHHRAVHLGRFAEGSWVSSGLAEGSDFFPGAILVDAASRFHLVWHDVHQDSYYLRGEAGELGKRKAWRWQKLKDWSHRSALAATAGGVLAVYEDYGSVLRSLFPEKISWSRRTDPAHVARPIFGSDPRLTWDTCHSQQFVIDRYGVPWLFFIDGSRQHLFYARWLGGQWGPLGNSFGLRENSPRMEDNHLPIDRLTVEERTPGHAEGIGLALANESRFPRTEFHQVTVPSLEAVKGKKVLFFDLQEIQELENLELKLNPAKKLESNPVIMAGGPHDFDAHGAGGALRVLKENGRYRMWYSGIFLDASKPWPKWGHLGYAESHDGYAFKKIKLGQVPFRGNRNTNIIKGPTTVPSVCFDPADPDPRRRYKLLKFPPPILHHEEARAGRMDPWNDRLTGTLYTSADGLRWKPEKAEIRCPAGNPLEIIPQSLFHDPREKDPGKKYKAYGFSSLNLGRRGGSYIYSPDGVNWTACPRNPVLDAWARCIPPVRGGKVHQIHDTVVWPYGDYYLALYHYQHSGEKLDVELAVSRDGENFVFVSPGQKVIPVGEPGSWDADLIAPGEPLVDGNEIRLYYGGLAEHHWKGNTTGVDYRRSGGLATLRLNGFTHLQLAPGRTEGRLTTIPITGSASPVALYVNCECGRAGAIAIEVLDPATGRAIPGYSRKECRRITGNSLRHRVTWRDQADLAGVSGRIFQLRFHFRGSSPGPKLYAFEFR